MKLMLIIFLPILLVCGLMLFLISSKHASQPPGNILDLNGLPETTHATQK